MGVLALPRRRTVALAFWVLVGCGAVYAAFHAVRADLPRGVWWGSTPSLLLPIAIAASIDLAPHVRFVSRRARAGGVFGATLIAAAWFEGIVPLLVESSVADWRDVAAMLVGGGLAAVLDFSGRR